jgi:hypothetical protein
MGNMEQEIQDLKQQLIAFTAVVEECKTINCSRKGPSGPQGTVGATGRPGRDAVCVCREVVGIQGERGLPGDINEAANLAVEKAYQVVTEEIVGLHGRLRDIVKSELFNAGVIDTNGKAVKLCRDGIDGKDGISNIPGPAGYTPQKGVDYFDGVVGPAGDTPQKGIDYFDGAVGPKGDSVKGDRGEKGESITGAPGKDSVVPGPQGRPGSIDAAIAGAEKYVRGELAKFRLEILAELAGK